VRLVEQLSGEKVDKQVSNATYTLSKMDNLWTALRFMDRVGVSTKGYTVKDIFNGNEDKIRMMLDAIRTRFPEDRNGNTPDYMYHDTATPMFADEDSPQYPPSGSHTRLPPLRPVRPAS
jgi:hypothetical protein